MKYKLYDFDKTIYKKDSTFEFYKFELKRNKKILKHIFKQAYYGVLFLLGIISKDKFKEKFYNFLCSIENIDSEVNEFWKLNKKYINKWFLNRKQYKEIVISASPEFLLKNICKELKIEILIASGVDKKTGKLLSKNCYGEEKVIRLDNEVKKYEIIEFYSDSYSDQPLSEISKKSYLVRGEKLYEWDKYEYTKKEKIKKIFITKEFIKFLFIGCINVFNGIFFAWLLSLILQENISFIIGYLIAMTISYFLNNIIVFNSKASFKKYIKFFISYIPNFIIQNLIVLLLYNILEINELISYACAAIVGVPITFICLKFFTYKK